MNADLPVSRRAVSLGLLGLAGVASLPRAFAQNRAKLVVIGGGFGGATAARYLKRFLPNADIVLVEPNLHYTACPFSNLVIGQARDLSAQKISYEGIRRSDIRIAQTKAVAIDPDAKEVRLETGGTLGYDRLILSPGIDLRWGAVEGYSQAAAQTMPHAWKAGPQTYLLAQQLAAMPDNGLVVISVPRAPYRCPPGPYERASLIAHYLKTHKPRAKLLVLDAKDQFSKMPLFQAYWAQNYGAQLEWRGAMDDGGVVRVDPASRTVHTDFESFSPDVANIIPPQKAAAIAEHVGVADATGWCPIDPINFESTIVPGIHVLGDATIAAPMPKSAFAANLQAKICALSIARQMSGFTPQPTILANTCYSFTDPESAISITGVYSNAEGRLTTIADSGGLSPQNALDTVYATEARQARDWFAAITEDAFG